MGKCGAKIDQSWTTDNVLDLTTQFYFNPYIDVDTFSVINIGGLGALRLFQAEFVINQLTSPRRQVYILQ